MLKAFIPNTLWIWLESSSMKVQIVWSKVRNRKQTKLQRVLSRASELSRSFNELERTAKESCQKRIWKHGTGRSVLNRWWNARRRIRQVIFTWKEIESVYMGVEFCTFWYQSANMPYMLGFAPELAVRPYSYSRSKKWFIILLEWIHYVAGIKNKQNAKKKIFLINVKSIVR
jgi:hypothetical protein